MERDLNAKEEFGGSVYNLFLLIFCAMCFIMVSICFFFIEFISAVSMPLESHLLIRE